MMRLPLVVLALAAACARAPAPPPPPSPLIETRWIMAESGADAPTIEFSQSRAGGYAGCNRWFAQVDSRDRALSFTGIGATRRMCSPEVMAIERTFLAALEATKTARIESDALVLQDVAGAELLRLNRVS
jgi:heat shock protein HslJ